MGFYFWGPAQPCPCLCQPGCPPLPPPVAHLSPGWGFGSSANMPRRCPPPVTGERTGTRFPSVPCAKSTSERRQPYVKRGPARSSACEQNSRPCQERRAAGDSAHAISGCVPFAKHKLCFAGRDRVRWVVWPWAPVRSPPDNPTDVSRGQLTPLSCAVPGRLLAEPKPS